MRTLAILFVAAAVFMWVSTPAQAAPAGGGTSGSSGAAESGSAAGGTAGGAAQSQASGSAGPTDLNMNNPEGVNPMEQANPAGGNPATSTQEATNNPPGSNAPAAGTRAFNNQGTGATINTPRGQIGIGANPSGGLNVDVNRNAAGNLPNAPMRQDLRDDRQNFRQDMRTQRQEQRQDNRLERQSNLNDPNRWRYSYQNGEWWYWLPNNSWTYWRDNQWVPYNADSFQPFGYQTGYRGAANNNNAPAFYYDESGRRYRRDYSPARPQNMEMQTGTSGAMPGGMQGSGNSQGESSQMSPSPQSNQTNEGGIGP